MKIKDFFKINIYLIVSLLVLYGLYLKRKTLELNYSKIGNKKNLEIILESKCNCRKNEILKINQINNEYKIDFIESLDSKLLKSYKLTKDEYSNMILTCDYYNVLKRGKNQNIIAYSLYGNNQKYYSKLKDIITSVRKYYPKYTIRIYHDDSINKSIICDLECFDKNTDFCDISNLKLTLTNQTVLNTSFIFPTLFRFLPIGDHFVDSFHSRDTDSYILQREVDAVDEFISSNYYAHIMRDHPQHTNLMLAGMWGVKSSTNRSLSNELFYLIINKNIYEKYKNVLYQKNGDQRFLKDIFYPKIRNKTLAHDSFYCQQYNSMPWPTQRKGNCFIGSRHGCNENAKYFECPAECRKNINWTSC